MQISSNNSIQTRARPTNSQTQKANQTKQPTGAAATADGYEGMKGASKNARCNGCGGGANASTQAEAAASVKKGVSQALQNAKGVAQALMSGGQSFEDMAAKFDKDKMQKDAKKGQVGSGTGVNHSKTTQSQQPASPSPARNAK